MRSVVKVSVTIIICMSLLCPFGLWASEQQPETKTEVAKVNGKMIPKKDFDVAYRHVELRMKSRGTELNASENMEVKKKVMENLIDSELMFQAAQKEKVEIDENELNAQWTEIKERMEKDQAYKENIETLGYSETEIKNQIRHQMSVEKFVTDKFVNTVSVTADKVKAYYDGNPKAFHTPEQIRASHILIKVDPQVDEVKKAAALKQMETIQKQIKNGDDFTALAKEHSECPSKSNGGDLGYFSRGQMVKPFEEAAFALAEGKTSNIVTTRFGYHLIKVTGKKAASNIPFDEAKKKIEAFLKQEKVQQEVARFLSAEKETAKIERFLQ